MSYYRALPSTGSHLCKNVPKFRYAHHLSQARLSHCSIAIKLNVKMIFLILVLAICFSASVAQQSGVSSPCESILESAIYKNMYINAGSTIRRPSASYNTFMQALCSLPPNDELPLPLSANPSLLAAFTVAASALSKSGFQWEYPGQDYDVASFPTSNMLKMVKNLNKAVCHPDKYTVCM